MSKNINIFSTFRIGLSEFDSASSLHRGRATLHQSMEVKPALTGNCWFSQNPTAFVMFGKEYYKSVIFTPSFSF